MQNVQQHKQAAQSFYVSYFTDILQHVFSVATDTSHTASKIFLFILQLYFLNYLYLIQNVTFVGLLNHAQILSYMFKLVESDRIEVLLSAPGAPPDGEVTEKNVAYVRDFVASLLKTAFPHLADPQIALTVQGMFNLNHDLTAFKDHLRDFLVQIRVSKILFINMHQILIFTKTFKAVYDFANRALFILFMDSYFFL